MLFRSEDDEKVFYFILSEEFDVISLNLNLERYYSISYNLIHDGKMDVPNMFNILHKFNKNLCIFCYCL